MREDNLRTVKKTRLGLHDSEWVGPKKRCYSALTVVRSHSLVVWYSRWSPVIMRWLQSESIHRLSVPKAIGRARGQVILLHHFRDARIRNQLATTVSVGLGWLMHSHAGRAIVQNRQKPLFPLALRLLIMIGRTSALWCAVILADLSIACSTIF